MKTTHDENKIDEIIQKIPNEMPYYEFTFYAMKEYAEYIREKTIDECTACVPEEQVKKKLTTNEQSWYKVDGHNTCREQTITNLNNLKNNEQ